MKKMKKALIVLLACTFAFAFVGCTAAPEANSKASSTPQANESSSSNETGGDGYKVGFAVNNLDETQKQIHDFLKADFKELNCELIMLNAAGKVDQQITDIENFMTMGVDMILVSALDSDALVDVCKQAMDKGIMVVDFIMGINTPCTMHIGYDFYEMTTYQAKILQKYLDENPDEILKMGYGWGTQGLSLCEDLYAGFTDTMNEMLKLPEYKDRIVPLVEGVSEWSSDTMITITEDWLQAYPDMNCIVTMSDTVTMGSIQALIAAGKDLSKWVLIGKDGSMEAAMKSVADGEMYGTVYCSYEELCKTVSSECHRLLTGETKEALGYEVLYTDYVMLTADNIGEYYKG